MEFLTTLAVASGIYFGSIAVTKVVINGAMNAYYRAKYSKKK